MRHEALIYDTDTDYQSSVGQALADAARRRRPVLLAAAGGRLSALARGPEGSDPEVGGKREVVDMSALGRNPSRIIPLIQGFLDAHRDEPAVVISEAWWPGRSSAELAEVTRHEALLNRAFGQTRTDFLCPYGREAVRGFAGGVEQTHPQLRMGDRSATRSQSYTDPGQVWRSTGRLDRPETPARTMNFDASGLPAVRAVVRSHALRARLPASRTQDLVLAVSELAGNSIRHGPGHGRLLLWLTAEALHCEVQDRGVLTDPLAGRRNPGPKSPGGRGLWLVNQLCDLVQLYATAEGVTVRVRVDR